MLKVTAPYSTTTEPKLARCQPRAQTINLVLGNRSPVAHFKIYLLAKFLMYWIQIFRQNI